MGGDVRAVGCVAMGFLVVCIGACSGGSNDASKVPTHVSDDITDSSKLNTDKDRKEDKEAKKPVTKEEDKAVTKKEEDKPKPVEKKEDKIDTPVTTQTLHPLLLDNKIKERYGPITLRMLASEKNIEPVAISEDHFLEVKRQTNAGDATPMIVIPETLEEPASLIYKAPPLTPALVYPLYLPKDAEVSVVLDVNFSSELGESLTVAGNHLPLILEFFTTNYATTTKGYTFNRQSDSPPELQTEKNSSILVFNPALSLCVTTGSGLATTSLRFSPKRTKTKPSSRVTLFF